MQELKHSAGIKQLNKMQDNATKSATLQKYKTLYLINEFIYPKTK